ncbi:hypothetical protein ACFVJS_08760 [Nocardioides sp. NPDC057772]|uniref:hypothetical protein n=1 Tax=Nocardioides sp. NPDC057772 TaxID=3346245 RepID=UPI003672CF5F
MALIGSDQRDHLLRGGDPGTRIADRHPHLRLHRLIHEVDPLHLGLAQGSVRHQSGRTLAAVATDLDLGNSEAHHPSITRRPST